MEEASCEKTDETIQNDVEYHEDVEYDLKDCYYDKISVIMANFPGKPQVAQIEDFVKEIIPGNKTSFKIITKLKKSEKVFSGYLFIHFSDLEEADKFCNQDYYFQEKRIDCRVLDNHSSFMERVQQNLQNPTKILIEGIPKNFNKNDVKNCVLKFGSIEEVVMTASQNKQFNNAYVKFTNSQTAKHCVQIRELKLKKGPVFRLSYAKPKFSTYMFKKVHPLIAEKLKTVIRKKDEYDPKVFNKLGDYIKNMKNWKDADNIKLGDIPSEVQKMSNEFELMNAERFLQNNLYRNQEAPQENYLENLVHATSQKRQAQASILQCPYFNRTLSKESNAFILDNKNKVPIYQNGQNPQNETNYHNYEDYSTYQINNTQQNHGYNTEDINHNQSYSDYQNNEMQYYNSYLPNSSYQDCQQMQPPVHIQNQYDYEYSKEAPRNDSQQQNYGNIVEHNYIENNDKNCYETNNFYENCNNTDYLNYGYENNNLYYEKKSDLVENDKDHNNEQDLHQQYSKDYNQNSEYTQYCQNYNDIVDNQYTGQNNEQNNSENYYGYYNQNYVPEECSYYPRENTNDKLPDSNKDLDKPINKPCSSEKDLTYENHEGYYYGQVEIDYNKPTNVIDSIKKQEETSEGYQIPILSADSAQYEIKDNHCPIPTQSLYENDQDKKLDRANENSRKEDLNLFLQENITDNLQNSTLQKCSDNNIPLKNREKSNEDSFQRLSSNDYTTDMKFYNQTEFYRHEPLNNYDQDLNLNRGLENTEQNE